MPRLDDVSLVQFDPRLYPSLSLGSPSSFICNNGPYDSDYGTLLAMNLPCATRWIFHLYSSVGSLLVWILSLLSSTSGCSLTPLKLPGSHPIPFSLHSISPALNHGLRWLFPLLQRQSSSLLRLLSHFCCRRFNRSLSSPYPPDIRAKIDLVEEDVRVL
jgi:hypothetical protein